MFSRQKVIMLRRAELFVKSLPPKVQDKIHFNIRKVETGLADKTVFKKLEGHELWEIRTKYFGNTYRLLCFFDRYTGGLVVATNGFMKKTEKTPQQEMELSEQIVKKYYIDNYPNR